jgi:hypothetical protein
MSGILKAPWQVGLAVAATFVSGVSYIEQALTHLFLITASDSLANERHDAIYHMTNKHTFDSALGIENFDEGTARIFTLVGVCILILGVFLWVGAFRGGVRVTLTVTLAVSFLGGFFPLFLAFDAANGLDTVGLAQAQIVNTIALIFSFLLWGKSGQKWVAIGAKQKWDKD